ncbi:hypothetical protein [Flavobacterium tructae]|uniref:carboxylesterase family protein n=1 Tax=Flavobacterium tructae TaxID=1114873 RepID=UPI0035A8C27E
MKVLYSFIIVCLSCVNMYSQVPVDNPYRTAYGSVDHWTNEIKWGNVVEASKIKGLIKNDNQINSEVLDESMKKLSQEGGGVLYFPPGVFQIGSDLKMYSNVVLRGADPIEKKKAIEEGYKPLTRFEFPKFIPSFDGAGQSHSALKKIYTDTIVLKNFGIVNLDLDRTTIEFHSSGYEKVITIQGSTMSPKNLHSNVIIYGVRINNSVALSPEIPTKNQKDSGFGWQRWPLSYISNINVNVSSNCVIANNRINDNVTDNFNYPTYITDLGRKIGENKVVFSYRDKPGISVNKYKVSAIVNPMDSADGKLKPYQLYPHANEGNDPDLTDLTSEIEPYLFPSGKIEIIENYVVTNTRSFGIVSNAKTNISYTDNKYQQVEESYFIEKDGKKWLNNYLSPKVDAMFTKHHAVLSNKDTINYRLLTPRKKGNTKFPIILYLHAEDMAGRDNSSQLNLFIPYLCEKQVISKYPAYILAPQDTNGDISWNAYEKTVTHGKVESALQLLDSVVKSNKNIDVNRIYVVGLSNGATVALRLGFENKNKFAAIVSLDGVELNIAKEKYEDKHFSLMSETPFWTSYPLGLKHLSLFQGTRTTALRIKSAGGKVVCKAYPGETRDDILYSYINDNQFLPWLFSQSRAKK